MKQYLNPHCITGDFIDDGDDDEDTLVDDDMTGELDINTGFWKCPLMIMIF